MAEVPNIPITRYDLSCPDEQLREILETIVCCTDCGFNAILEDETNDLVITHKSKEYRINLDKYLDDTRVTNFYIQDKKLILEQSDNSKFEILLQDIINLVTYKGTFITSSPGILTEIEIPHNLGFEPMFYNIQTMSYDAEGYCFVKATPSKFIIYYETAPKVGLNNIKFNWTVTI